MLFNSVSFLIFFPIVVAATFSLRPAWRNPFLLLASCFFYMSAIPQYILVLFFIIAVDYTAGIKIEGSRGPARRRWLLASLAANIGTLLFFKSLSHVQSAAALFHIQHQPAFLNDLLLPIGLSFHTFQAMSYTLEVYRGTQKAERNPVTYALYVMFFPQLVAGPIERPAHLLPQLRKEHSFRYDDAVEGMRMMLWGMFKKVAVADTLAVVVDQVFNDLQGYSGWILPLATVLFAFQIYCDFSGYSDIAIGAARVLGFKLVVNFRNPYVSASFPEFWKRWHISLSSWFRDYLYIPLGGNRVPAARHALNLFVTFLISGLWHGFALTFAVWGALHALYVILGHWTAPARQKLAQGTGLDRFPRLHHALKVAGVFTLTCFAWIFFRAKDLGDAWYVVTHLWGPALRWQGERSAPLALSDLGWNPYFTAAALLLILLTQWANSVLKDRLPGEVLAGKPPWVRWGLYYLAVLLIASEWILSGTGPKQFLYFQF